MRIVEARGSHLLQIARISQTLSRPDRLTDRNGFLCDTQAQPRFSDFLNTQSFLVLQDGADLAGFVLAAPITHPGLALERSLLSQASSEGVELGQYLVSDNIYVKRIAISPEYQRCGFGRSLYAELTTRFPTHHLMAAIIEAPYNNIGSSKFHRAHGFIRAATFTGRGIFGFKEYAAGIYLRPPGPILSSLSELLRRDAA